MEIRYNLPSPQLLEVSHFCWMGSYTQSFQDISKPCHQLEKRSWEWEFLGWMSDSATRYVTHKAPAIVGKPGWGVIWGVICADLTRLARNCRLSLLNGRGLAMAFTEGLWQSAVLSGMVPSLKQCRQVCLPQQDTQFFWPSDCPCHLSFQTMSFLCVGYR